MNFKILVNFYVTRLTILVSQIVFSFARVSYIDTKVVYALQGDKSFKLECYRWAYPEVISAEWYFRSRETNITKKLGTCSIMETFKAYRCYENKLLIVKSLSKEDDGYYTCFVDNGEEKHNLTTLLLSTKGPVLSQMSTWFVLYGSGHVKCRLHESTKFTKLEWKLNQKIIKERENKTDWFINPITKKHSGKYTCIITTMGGVRKATINIVVQNPMIVTFFGNVTWMPGKQLVGCAATFDFMQVTPDKILFTGPQSRKRVDTRDLTTAYHGNTTTVTYEIDDAKDTDFGCYRCYVALADSAIYWDKKCFWGEGRYTVTIFGEYFVKDNDGSLFCKVLSTFNPIHIEWWFNGKIIPAATELTLEKKRVTKADEGYYTCVVEEDFRIENRTKLIRVEYPPKVEIHAYGGGMDEPKFINCSVDARPLADEVFLKHKGVRIHKFTAGKTEYMLPKNILLSEGCYDCVAENFYGSGSHRWCYKPYATGPSRNSTLSTRTSLIIWVVSGTVILIALIGTAIGMIRLINRNSSNSVTAFTIGAIHVKSLAIREDFQKMSAAELKRLEDLHDENKAEDENLSDTSDEGKQQSETGRQNAAQPDDPFMYRVGSAGSLSHSAGKKKPKRKKIKNAKKLKKLKDSVPKKNNSSSSIIKLPLKTDTADE